MRCAILIFGMLGAAIAAVAQASTPVLGLTGPGAHEGAATPEQKLRAAVAFLDDAERMKWIDALAADKARKAAAVLAYVRDTKRYPDPPDASAWSPGEDVQKGQLELEKLTIAAIAAHNDLEAELLKACGAAEVVEDAGRRVRLPERFGEQDLPSDFDVDRLPVRGRGSISEPTSRPSFAGTVARPAAPTNLLLPANEEHGVPLIVYQVVRSEPAWTHYLDAIEENAAAEEREAAAGKVRRGGADWSPLIGTLRQLARGEYGAAARSRSALNGRQRWWVDVLAVRCVSRYNARDRGAGVMTVPSLAELEIIDAQNDYRIALGLLPWVLDDRLLAAARAHSTYQAERRKIMHAEDDPAMRHAWDRAAHFGYPPADIAENISHNLGPWTVWGWRADAAHHRAVLRTDLKVCGVGRDRQFVTCVAASRDQSEIGKLLKR